MPCGIIIKGIGGFYYVRSQNVVYECRARGIFRKDGLTPLPGDCVSFSLTADNKPTGCIDRIYPRESCLQRPAAANINQVVIVIALKSPLPDLLLLDKLLITAEQKNIAVVICLNKIDLDKGDEYKEITDAYKGTGYRLILTSSKTNIGQEQLKNVLCGRTSVFAGQSGVGKSTILNMIMNKWAMQTGVLSEKTDRGMHTTRHVELLELEFGGYVVDTPGFSSFELDGMESIELPSYYPEFKSIGSNCRFTRCSHISEPDCRVKEALNGGSIDEGRYRRYMQLHDELKSMKKR